jgi:hypothetical protein
MLAGLQGPGIGDQAAELKAQMQQTEAKLKAAEDLAAANNSQLLQLQVLSRRPAACAAS